jgi:hypothetical protein
LTQEEEKYYNTYFDLFLTPGWKEFKNEIQAIFDDYRIEDIKDERHLAFVKGERDALRRVLHFDGGIKRTYDIIKEREAEQ